MTNYNERLDEVFETLNNKAREERASCTERNNWEGYTSAYERLESDAKQAITSLIKELVVDIDTDVDIPEALKKIYNDGYSKGYNDRTYENSYNSVDYRMAEAIAPAVAKVRSRYDKQLKALEEDSNE